jgi:superfamily II DNA or RNA helicase/HKD family nuclease
MLKAGLYDDLITQTLRDEISRLQGEGVVSLLGKIEAAQLPDYLTRFLAAKLFEAIRSFGNNDAPRQVALTNAVLELVSRQSEDLAYLLHEKITLDDQVDLLEEICGDKQEASPRPLTHLSSSSLLTGAPGLPQLGRELELELATADRCDMLVSFVKSGGMRLMRDSLQQFTARGGKLRLITTSYLGASDPSVVEEIAKLPNTEVRINYDTHAARLHAKAYFFHRESGLSTAYIGSANLSHAAMTSGLEWTVKCAARELPHLFRRCAAEFSGYWENPSFELYDPQQPQRFRDAIRKERNDFDGQSYTPLTVFDLAPHPFQQEILEALAFARESRSHFRNLIIAATGTGKTMIAAFDYRNESRKLGRHPKLLFIAHRKEILEQALGSFRQVLKDGNFGGLLVDGLHPHSMDHVFCSIQSFTSQRLHEVHGVDAWDYVVIDEAHHAEAKSYDAIIDLLQPKFLLGLTATPERTDGSSVAIHFDRPVAAEIRLPDALQDKLLCPFHYFAISDATVNYSQVAWSRGRYDDKEIQNLLNANHLRAQLVLDKLREYLPDPYGSGEFDRKSVRALGFCVGIKHAEFMASFFQQAGIAAEVLTSNTDSDTRKKLRADLATGRINVLFVVDVFNEGVDIPEINCVLFLRPTESHIVYLQQLGRGLRRTSEDKCLTVLDFVGQCRREFRYDLRFSSLLPSKRNRLVEEVENGFPHLPSGCAIVMERQAKETILTSIKRTYQNPEFRIRDAFSQWPEDQMPSFREFIEVTQEDPIDLLSKRSWSQWKSLTRNEQLENDPDLAAFKLHLALVRTALQRAPQYLNWLARLAKASGEELKLLATEAFAKPAYQILWNRNAKEIQATDLTEAYIRLTRNASVMHDLAEVVDFAQSRSALHSKTITKLPETLELHGLYSSSEINAIFGADAFNGRGAKGVGVIHFEEQKVIVHLVTFEKNEKQFSESTMYRDFPTAPDLLHWESQANTTQTSKIGKIYANHETLGYRILFFTRIRKQVTNGVTSPFLFLGEGKFLDASGNRPIAIRWQMQHLMPMGHYREARRVCGLEE